VRYESYEYGSAFVSACGLNNTLTLSHPQPAQLTNKSATGFFLDNEAEFCQEPNTWSFDRSTGQLVFYSLSDPNHLNVRLALQANGLVGSNGRGVTVRNIAFQDHIHAHVNLTQWQNVSLIDLETRNSGDIGLAMMNITMLTVQNSTIEYSNGVGIQANGAAAAWHHLIDNTIVNVGAFAGYGHMAGGQCMWYGNSCLQHC
jgi:hypothetical protein